MENREARQIKLMMLITFAIGAWVIMLIHVSFSRVTIHWLEYIGPPIFSALAFLYWRHWEPATLIEVLLLSTAIGFAQLEPFVTQQASFTLLLPPILALVLLTPRWVVISPAITLLVLLARANWQGVYSDPVFLSIYIMLIAGLLISRWMLELNKKQIESLNHTLEQRITRRTSDLLNTLTELRMSEGRLRAVVTNAPIILFGLNKEGIFTVAEGSGLALLGIDPQDIIGKSVFRLYANQPQVVADLQRALAGETLQSIRSVREYIFETWYTPLRDINGDVSGMTGVSVDITERLRAEEELARSLKFAQSVNNATPDIVYVYNLATNQTISSNRSLLKMLGYTPEQIQEMGQAFFPQAIHPEEFSSLAEQYQALANLPDEAIHESEYRLRTADGGWRWLSSREVIFQRHLDGTPDLVLGIATDITERKAAEDAISRHIEELDLANHELAQAARLKNEFLANMSHELRTPLASILGRSELLQDEHSGSLTEFQRRSVRGIEESGRHLLEMINDILDLSKIEAGKLLLEIQPLPLADLIRTCTRVVTEAAQRKHLDIQITLDAAVTLIDADPRRLKQILVNLLGNAVKFTPEGGEIGLEVRGNPTSQTVDLTIWDTGIGIDASDQTRLFQPFVQLDSGLARQYDGTGLGLALVERLTKQHGGQVTLISQLGQGSRFTVTLPWRPTSSPAIAPLPPTEPAVAALIVDDNTDQILLVEDNPETLMMVAEYLTLRGYRVTKAQTGAEALASAHAELPALIIMDIQLPDIDGLTATRTLRADPVFAATPILILSAHAMPGDRVHALAAGANAYMSKPVRLSELLHMAATLIHPAHASNQVPEH